MGKEVRKVIAIHERTGEKRVFDKVADFATEMAVTNAAVLQTLNRNGVCCGWRLYDAPEFYRKRIDDLEFILKKVEEIGG